ncbi:hypothetical protein B0T24DRAFT_327555 [Lasiosphaeria ovina]|uniref:Myb-like domain-containing protein n=1 Tax=Lasiosphaeria ovina TaxID=92902 RepID=A0AAE0K7G8_9PEZI|nr:hypothetical protein B0T24DRAFT_327555 [Lasiosphaeria ovina]
MADGYASISDGFDYGEFLLTKNFGVETYYEAPENDNAESSGDEVVLTQPCTLQRSLSPSQTPPRPSPALSAAGQAIPGDNANDIPSEAGIGNTSNLGSPSLGSDAVDDNVSDSSRYEDDGAPQSCTGTFQDWRLEDAVLKRVIVDGVATFQLQFSWTPYAADCVTGSRQSGSPAKMRLFATPALSDSPVKSRRSRTSWSREEDTLLIDLRNQGLRWNEISKRFAAYFGVENRSQAALQTRYSRVMMTKGRESSSGSRLPGIGGRRPQSETVVPIDPALGEEY